STFDLLMIYLTDTTELRKNTDYLFVSESGPSKGKPLTLSWTIDIMPIRERKADAGNCKSLSLGTITCMHKINEHLREQFNGEADEILLKDVMITGSSVDLPPKYLTVIQNDLKTYVEDIMGQLRALQFNLDTTQLIFIGGGSTIIKNFLDAEKYPKATVIDDVHINAKGYEDLIRYQIRNGGLK
ncbi:MAG: hypothetical protein MRZ36_03060, partial [Eubacterium sp.]|nr:hypothetical protein [Eubacterium sp.]